MIVITHVRMDATGTKTYECIERVRYYVAQVDPATMPNVGVQVITGEGDVAEMVYEVKHGTMVVSDGNPKAEVEIFVRNNREYIRTKADANTSNNLLSLPSY